MGPDWVNKRYAALAAFAVILLLIILLVGGGVTTFLGFFGTLFATLIGVGAAFWLDRRANEQRKKQRVLHHLRALREELDMNGEAANENIELLGVLSGRKPGGPPEADHYVLSLYSVDAWEAALQEQLLGIIPPELYHEFQQLYSQIRSTNELIRRLRTQGHQLNPEGRPSEREEAALKNVDYVVAYWDAEEEEADIWMLGILIEMRSRDVADAIGQVSDTLDEEIGRLEDEVDIELVDLS